MSVKEIANHSYSKISDALVYKLMDDYKNKLISIDEFRKISRSVTAILDYTEIHIYENRESKGEALCPLVK